MFKLLKGVWCQLWEFSPTLPNSLNTRQSLNSTGPLVSINLLINSCIDSNSAPQYVSESFILIFSLLVVIH